MVRWPHILLLFFLLFPTPSHAETPPPIFPGRLVLRAPDDQTGDSKVQQGRRFQNRLAAKLRRHKKVGVRAGHSFKKGFVTARGKRLNQPLHHFIVDLNNTEQSEAQAIKETYEALAELKADPTFKGYEIEVDPVSAPLAMPNDPYLTTSGAWGQSYQDLWGHYKINAPSAWDLSTGSGVTVAIMDTGIDTGHADLAGQILPGGYNFYSNNTDLIDRDGHGTHVAGTVAAVANNGIGIAGIAHNAKLLIVRTCDPLCPHTAMAAALIYAADNGAKVINISIGSNNNIDTQALLDAIKYAWDAGMVVVIAAGNDAADTFNQVPGRNPYAIQVAASAPDDTRVSFSNFGARIGVSAPGGPSSWEPKPYYYSLPNILSLFSAYSSRSPLYVVNSQYARLNGTSMAAPHVTAVAALIRSLHPTYTNEQVRQAIYQGADDIDSVGFSVESGYGRLNAYGALNVVNPIGVMVYVPWGLTSGTSYTFSGLVEGDSNTTWQLEYGDGATPSSWTLIAQGAGPHPMGTLATWDFSAVSAGRKTIRLTANDGQGHSYSHRGDMDIKSAGSITAPPTLGPPLAPPTAPTGPSYLAGTAPTTMYVSWGDNANNETGFEIEFATAGASGPYTLVYTAPANTNYYYVPNRLPNTTYWVRVRAVNQYGASDYNGVASAATPNAIPSAPSSLVASNVNYTMSLAWADNSNNETSFVVHRSTDGTTFALLTTLAANVTSYVDTNAAYNTTYYYKVASANALGTSAFTAIVSRSLPTPPLAPASPGVSPFDSATLLVTWSDNNASETGYEIQRGPAVNGPFSTVTTTAADAVQYYDSGLAKNTTYYYRLRAQAAEGPSAFTAVVSATTLDTIPTVPSGLGGSAVSSTQVDLTWTDNSDNETEFVLERATSLGGPFNQIATPAANGTAYSDTGLTKHTVYYYRIAARNAVGTSGTSVLFGVATPDTIPAAPSNLSASAPSSTAVSLSWTDNSDNESTFVLERAAAVDGPYSQVATPAANATGYSDAGLTKNTTYYYRIGAQNAVGTSAKVSASVTTPNTLPTAPSGLSASAQGTSQVDLTWADTSDNETGFVIQHSTDNVLWSTLTTTAAGATSYSHSSLAPNSTHYYRVAATNLVGNSAPSASVQASTLPLSPGAPATVTARLVSPGYVRVNWEAGLGEASGFRIERSSDGSQWALVEQTGPGLRVSYVDIATTESPTERYRVIATNAGGESAPTVSTEVTLPLALPSAPTEAHALIRERSYLLTWNYSGTGRCLVEWAATDEGPFYPLAEVACETKQHTVNAPLAANYRFRIRAFNSGGSRATSPFSLP